MQAIRSCSLVQANYLYITNPIWKHAPRNANSRHNLIFVTEGVLYIEMQGVRYTVRPGEFLFLPHGALSNGYRPSGVPTGFFFAVFNASPVPELPTHFTLNTPMPVRTLYAQLIRAAHFPDYSPEGMNAHLHALLHEVVYQLKHADQQPENTLAAKIKYYIDSTVFRNLTVQDVAAHFGLCADYINRVFSQAEHMTVKTYITQRRLGYLEEYLSSVSTPIKTIAEKLHFSSPSALSKFYKYHTGRTPEQYRDALIDTPVRAAKK